MDHMIEINLLPGSKRKKKGGGGVGFVMPNFKEMITGINDPLMLGAIGSWVVSIAVVVVLFVMYSGSVGELEPERDRLRSEKNRFQRELTLARSATVMLDSLGLELAAIRQIDATRFVWPHILDEVSRALPQFTWFRSIDMVATVPTGGIDAPVEVNPLPTIVIDARTSEIGQATRFVRRLAESPWFTAVELGRTQAGIEEERSVVNFTVQATFKMADSAFIRTVPVTAAIE
jgi:Tfp pilus assembly protein PilN